MQLKINVKKISGKQSGIAQLALECPVETKNVRELLTVIVTYMVTDYKKRKQQGEELLSVLTGQEIEEKSASGKIGFGILYGKNNPSLEKSVQTALQCFADGMVALFVDGKQVTELEEELMLQEGSELTFVRLIPLAGRMW